MVGKIPFDEAVVKAVVEGVPLMAYDPDGQAAQEMRTMWMNVVEYLDAL